MLGQTVCAGEEEENTIHGNIQEGKERERLGYMIHIKKTYKPYIIEIDIKGHAGYEEQGKDIVCAAVSALAQGILCYLEKMGMVEGKRVESGHLHMTLKMREMTIQMTDMLFMACEEIEQSYPGSVEVDIGNQ